MPWRRPGRAPLATTTPLTTQLNVRCNPATRVSTASSGVRPAKGNQHDEAGDLPPLGRRIEVAAAILPSVPFEEKLLAGQAKQPAGLAVKQSPGFMRCKYCGLSLGFGPLCRVHRR